mmetsp:Transcript_25307/g.58839  ORF Transcript_25307/g.58839 Transcript_25307/m.58839 type:complete len:153 (-) Transcript_25307:431-889(-)
MEEKETCTLLTRSNNREHPQGMKIITLHLEQKQLGSHLSVFVELHLFLSLFQDQIASTMEKILFFREKRDIDKPWRMCGVTTNESSSPHPDLDPKVFQSTAESSPPHYVLALAILRYPVPRQLNKTVFVSWSAWTLNSTPNTIRYNRRASIV